MLVIVGLVGTLYTFLGGMKAVIWTNVIQFAFIAVGLLVILTSLCLQLDGGAARVLQLAEETGARTSSGSRSTRPASGLFGQFCRSGSL